MGRAGVAFLFLILQVLILFILIWGLKIPRRFALWLIFGFVLFSLPLPYILWLQAGARQPPFFAAALIVRPFFAWQFNWLCFLVFLVPVIVLARAGAALFGSEMIITILRWAVFMIAMIWGSATIFGLWDTTNPPMVEKLELEIKGLPLMDHGIRVVQLSDPHVSWWNSKQEICETGRIIAGLEPDLLVITGDMVDHNPRYVHAFADCMEEVSPRLGRYAIIGNHDVYTGTESVARLMQARGFRMLRNEWISLENKGAHLALAGIDDSGLAWTSSDPQEKRIPEILAGCPRDLPVILLAHRPSAFEHVKGLPVALTLAGHTHGGQMKLPFRGPGLADIGFAHPSGLYKRGDQVLYVSRGTGTVGWPFRLNCPKEITLIILCSTKTAGSR
jgi:predicted MPP superfamily phosphohydrolase